MTKVEFSRSMAKLAAAYREHVDEPTLEVYYEMLGRQSDEAMAFITDQAIRTLKWFPKIAELIDLAHDYVPERLALPAAPAAPLEYHACPQGILAEFQERNRRLRGLMPARWEPSSEELQAHALRKAQALGLLQTAESLTRSLDKATPPAAE